MLPSEMLHTFYSRSSTINLRNVFCDILTSALFMRVIANTICFVPYITKTVLPL